MIESIPEYDEDVQPYRAVSKSAVLSLMIGLLSFAALLFPVLLALPPVGIVEGVVALAKVRRYPNELPRRPAAVLGLLLGGRLLVART